MIELTGLKPATIYTVAVRAVTAIGAGPLGNAKSEKTLEDSEYFFIASMVLRTSLIIEIKVKDSRYFYTQTFHIKYRLRLS